MLCIVVIVVIVVIFITLSELCSTPTCLQSAATVDGAAGVLGSGEDPLNFLPQDELLGMLIGDGLGKNGESESNFYLFSLGNTACMKLRGNWVTSYNVDSIVGLPKSDNLVAQFYAFKYAPQNTLSLLYFNNLSILRRPLPIKCCKNVIGNHIFLLAISRLLNCSSSITFYNECFNVKSNPSKLF